MNSIGRRQQTAEQTIRQFRMSRRHFYRGPQNLEVEEKSQAEEQFPTTPRIKTDYEKLKSPIGLANG